jgi:hypothetical protein
MNSIQQPTNFVNSTHDSVISEPTKSIMDVIPNEIIAKIIDDLPMQSISRCRILCRKIKNIIDNMPNMKYYLNIYWNSQRNKHLFDNHYNYDISLKAKQNNFISYIERSNLISKKDLDKIKSIIIKLGYYEIQYLLATTIDNTLYSLKRIANITRSTFIDYESSTSLPLKIIKITEDSDTLLCATNHAVYELKIIEGSVKLSRQIFDARSLNTFHCHPFIQRIFYYKQNIVITYKTLYSIRTRFFHKVDGIFYDVTPKELLDSNNWFIGIGMFVDKQGSNILISRQTTSVVFYYMPNSYDNLNSENIKEYSCISEQIIDKNFSICDVQVSKSNNLMTISGKNRNSGKDEVHIYKCNTKIYTHVFNNEKQQYKAIREPYHKVVCSPAGNYFAIFEKINWGGTIKFSFYSIADNEVKDISSIKLTSIRLRFSEFIFKNIKYNNSGDKVLISDERLLLSYSQDNVSGFYMDEKFLYNRDAFNGTSFNKSGNMLLRLSIDGLINIYDFRNKQITESEFRCIGKASKASFSPNSQLIVTVEKADNPEHNVYNTLRIYKMMDFDENNELQIIANPYCIAKYITPSGCEISSFKFYSCGTKLIITEHDAFEILELARF